MSAGTPFLDVWHVTIALGLGLLVGLERERAGKELGIRTFSFSALLGYLAWQMGSPFAVAVLALSGVIVVIINVRSLSKGAGVEATTSVSLFLIVFVGMLVAQDELTLAVAVVVFMLLLLSWKEEMVLFSRALQRQEIHAAITLGLLTFVILPVLPPNPVDPWGLFAPRRIWLMVVLISAISFGNYVLLKLYGVRGITYTGFLAGLVNSNATSAALAQQARHYDDPRLEDLTFRGIMWAQTAAFLRNGIILAMFAPEALPAGVLPVGLIMTVTVTLALLRRPAHDSHPPRVAVESPFSLRPALGFGAMFAVITVLGSIAQQLAGDWGVYAVSFAGGLVSSASTAATAAALVSAGRIDPLVAGSAVVLASLASAIVILLVVWKGSGKPRFVRRFAFALAWEIVAILAGIALNPLFLDEIRMLQSWLRPQ